MQYVFIVIIILLAFFLIGFVVIVKSFQPDPPDVGVYKLKSFLGFKFSSEFVIIDYRSQNNHPDRPMNLKISLSPEDFEKVIIFLGDVALNKEIIYSDEKCIYSESWTKYENVFYKSHNASYKDAAIPFFIASLIVDCNDRTLSYKETGI